MRTDQIIRCPGCGKALDALVAGKVIIRTPELEAIGRIYSIRCGRCGATWQAPDARGPVHATASQSASQWSGQR